MPGAGLCVANLFIVQKRIEEAGKKAVREWGAETIKISKEDYCPRDTGLLVGTGDCRDHKNTSTEFYVRLSYSTPYAPYVHEIPKYYHPIGQYKFLSTPFNLRSALLIKTIESAMKGVL
jgi:hypothetical protein